MLVPAAGPARRCGRDRGVGVWPGLADRRPTLPFDDVARATSGRRGGCADLRRPPYVRAARKSPELPDPSGGRARAGPRPAGRRLRGSGTPALLCRASGIGALHGPSRTAGARCSNTGARRPLGAIGARRLPRSRPVAVFERGRPPVVAVPWWPEFPSSRIPGEHEPRCSPRATDYRRGVCCVTGGSGEIPGYVSMTSENTTAG